ncbi:unnamed protein product [Candidula unifasciata]|uniref:GH3 domain-containing protein n=1 Tax=Candidula unifasciata TaxID=100452 RepID=A0A8S3YV55_9EUPU|nr:unnamed protein product [Candidula unifasciata]
MPIISKLFFSVSIGLSGIGYIALDVTHYRTNPDQSFLDAAKHYVVLRSMAIYGELMKNKLEEATRNIKKAQTDFLMNQLQANLDTEYSREMKLDEVRSVKDFLRTHPLTTYSDYSKNISRMMSGEKKVLTSSSVDIFAVTSGTSGASNIIPAVSKQTRIFFSQGVSVMLRCMLDAYPNTKHLNKVFRIFYTPNWRYTMDGVPIGPNAPSPDRSTWLHHMYTTPSAVYEIRSEPPALYLYLLFALLDPHVGMIEANFSTGIFNAFATLELKLAQLTTDIELGRIDPDLKIDHVLRKKLNSLLVPNPKRANEIREAAELGKDNLAQRIWPELCLLIAADTGTFDLYATRLRESYCKGVPLYSPLYAASEGLLGINIWPKELPSHYLLHPHAQFFEFIPEHNMDEEQPNTYLMHQVKEGSTYELVITNPSCLYRYRFGDVVKVVGFHNQCPVVEFKYRKGQFLNVRGEKVSEALFYEILKGTITKIWKDIKLADYCCTESNILDTMDVPDKYKTSQPCYHVFVELENDDGSKEVRSVSSAQKKMLDDALMVHSHLYSSFRYKGTIDPVQVHVVERGSFLALRRFILEQPTAASNQYKVPRVLRKQEAVKFILDRVVE